MDRKSIGCHQAQPHASTHVVFCEMLQRLAKSQVLYSPSEAEINHKKSCCKQAAFSLNVSPLTSRRRLTREPSSKCVCALPENVSRRSDTSGEKDDKLKPYYSQVVKETTTAFVGRQLYQRLLNCENEGRSVGQINTVKTHNFSTSDSQSLLRRGIAAFVEAVACQESGQRELAKARQIYFTQSSPEKLREENKQLALVRQIPLREWAGMYHYNTWFVKCPLPSLGDLGGQINKTGGKQRTGTRIASTSHRTSKQLSASLLKSELPTMVSATVAASTPKTLVLPADIEAELQKYWKLHDEAAARLRLEALRNHDAEAFAKHVSLLKISALLGIMEKTEGFMRRIGMRLESQAAGVTGAQAQLINDKERGDTELATYTSKQQSALVGRNANSDYARFKAYVSSSSVEFKLMHRIDAFVPSQPHGLRATLLPHQMDGLRFLASLHANHINGILADEMGVGKTIQTLAFLLYLKEELERQKAADIMGGEAMTAEPQRPHLVLAPLSVIREWREACEQFVFESFRVGLFQEMDDPVADAPTYDLLLMPVHAVRHSSAAAAARVQWNYVVVDEAHKAVANLKTFTARAILSLPCARRLVLTGTPLSNDLRELWSLLHFLNPSVFSDNDAFDEVFRRPFQVYEAKEVELTEEERGLLVLRLHQVLRPFLLRRSKADIDASLRMTFHRVQCPLSLVQERVLRILREDRRTPAVLHAEEASDSSEDNKMDGVAKDEEVGCADAASLCMAKLSGTEGSDPRTADTSTLDASSGLGALSHLAQLYLPGLAAPKRQIMLQRQVCADKRLGFSSANVTESAAQQVCNHVFMLPFFSQVLQRHGLDELTLETTASRRDANAVDKNTPSSNGAAAMTLASSGKFLLLHLLLSRLFVAGRKAVLFTHWLDCVDLLLDYLHSRGWHTNAEVLTGASSETERQAGVRRFRDDPACLFFLLSIKAGGCGINLQAAHVVVLLDRDYTATNEDQALARVYRIGQRHTVRAIYFTTDDVSEHRVMQRAAEKNRPRRAIIDGGAYQVTDSPPNATKEDDDENALETKAADDRVVDEILTEEVWRSAVAVQRTAKECVSTSEPTHDDRVTTSACVPSSRKFWSALRQLVHSLDDLVLTEEDRREGAERENAEEDNEIGSVVDAAGSLAKKETGALRRLRTTLPPESLDALEKDLQNIVKAQTDKPLPSSPVSSAASSAAAFGPNEDDIHSAASVTRSNLTRIGCCTHDEESASRCRGVLGSTTTETENVCLDPFRSPALFWLEYAYLVHLSRESSSVLATALGTAEQNHSRKDDTEEQLQWRQRRDRRAAKRMRLATVEVPDAFREKCWEDGVEDDAEVAERYLAYVEDRRNRRKEKYVSRVA